MDCADASPLLGLPARVGQLATAPDAALARVEAEGGGLRDALALVVAAVVAFRLPELVHAVLDVAGPTSGAFMRLVALFAERGAARRLVRAAGRGRRDVPRAASGATPGAISISAPPATRRVFIAAGLERALAALTGPRRCYRRRPTPSARRRVAILVWRAVRVARARPPARTASRGRGAAGRADARPARAGSAPVRRNPDDRRASSAARSLALALALTAHGAVWSARNVEVLRPIAARPARAGLLARRASTARPGAVALSAPARPGGRARLLGHLVRALRRR